MNRLAASLGVTGALMFGIGAVSEVSAIHSERPEPAFVGPAISADQLQTMNQDFTELRAYWVAREAGVATVKLVVLKSKDSFDCAEVQSDGSLDHGKVHGDEPGLMVYCSGDDSVVMSQASINLLNANAASKNFPGSDFVEIILAHEVGHSVQRAEGRDVEPASIALQRRRELQADCYGGEALAAIDPAVTHEARASYTTLSGGGVDPTHGTDAERIASFLRGAELGEC